MMNRYIKFLIIALILLRTNHSYADEPVLLYKRHIIKLNLISLAGINLATLKGSYEYISKDAKTLFETELGYTYFSREEQASTRGFYTGFSVGGYIKNKPRFRTYVKINPFYQKLYMNDYLKYTVYENQNSYYYEYKKTEYTKERSGCSIINGLMYYFNNTILLEANYGFGLIYYKTTVPDDVSQKSFRNGLRYSKEYMSPNFILSLKLGFSF